MHSCHYLSLQIIGKYYLVVALDFVAVANLERTHSQQKQSRYFTIIFRNSIYDLCGNRNSTTYCMHSINEINQWTNNFIAKNHRKILNHFMIVKYIYDENLESLAVNIKNLASGVGVWVIRIFIHTKLRSKTDCSSAAALL
jgi:hypothetical protein